MANDRLVGWVDVLARGCGLPASAVAGLTAGVSGALARARSEGVAVDWVRVARRDAEFEVVLLADTLAVDTFVFVV